MEGNTATRETSTFSSPALCGLEIALLDAIGKVTDAKLVVDDPLFGPAILDALKRMEFAPAQDGG